MLAAFPVVAGPILLVLSLEHGAAFAAQAAAGTMSAIFAILVFGMSYAWSATRFSWRRSVVLALSAYLLAVIFLVMIKPDLLTSAIAIFSFLPFAKRFYPSVAAEKIGASKQPNDVWLRMLAGGILVFVVSYFGSAFGAVLSGVLAMFPSIGLVLATFSHRNFGSDYVVQLLQGMVSGYYAFGAFCLTLALTLQKMPIPQAFCLALLLATLAHFFAQALLKRRT